MQNYHHHQVDLTNCDNEPIHQIGQIQPYGFLFILHKDSLEVEQASKNVQEFLPYPLEDVLGKTLSELVAPGRLEFNPTEPGTYFLSIQGVLFTVHVHLSEEKLILEGEPYVPYPDTEKLRHNSILCQLYDQLNKLDALEPVALAVAHTLREVLQYDRVDITRFDEEWNTDVIAESRSAHLSSFEGHHFPATDIPAPARELLRQKHVRQIPNVNARAVEISPYLNPGTGAPANILRSELRNPSEIHLEYIRNTGVSATISFSIIVKNQLWGVVACHHVEPVFIDVWRRQLCDLMCKTLGNAIAAIQEKRDIAQFNQYKQVEQALVQYADSTLGLSRGLSTQELTLLDLTGGHGAALVLDGEMTMLGVTPPEEQVRQLIKWLSGHVPEGVFATRQLSAHWPEAAPFQEQASGLLALEISRYNQEYLLFFKPEITETRIWAGNPEKPMLGQGLHIHPRKSFEEWVEVIKGKSQPWNVNEVDIAQVLLKDLIAIRLRNQAQDLQTLNEELLLNAEQLRTKNAQLEDFAYIISHNLRSPLANIKSLYQFYVEEPGEETSAYVMDSIKQVSDNIMATLDDLNVILETHLVQQLPQEEVNLEELIQKEKENLAAVLEQTQAQVVQDLQVSSIFMPKLYLESILHNFISNALKYRSPQRQPVITVKSWRTGSTLHLAVQDNGIGMDLDKMGSKLFGLYKVFHRTEHSKGLGLYLTKMQVKALGGTITVDSQPGEGTTFTVHFNQIEYSPEAR
ncbi:GAF domain-containing protein [Nibribacter ruber]|uniref:histidine kinase n=1 Tax=Nibribacter ruber TaxID=2698458 RepID=A0A6P1P0H4_9BACT|nr:ATP-binding protein [Nibribacter ruber]QHL88075.1 GAF domain-containing protein [Nibribacter ruber]